MAIVLEPFAYAADGFTIEHLKPGDDRDFGASTAGLVAAGLVSDEPLAVEADETAVEPPVAEPDGETPVEEAPVAVEEAPAEISVAKTAKRAKK